LSKTSGARKLILGLQVNIDEANSRRYDVTRQMVYSGPQQRSQSAHQCTVYILRSQDETIYVMSRLGILIS